MQRLVAITRDLMRGYAGRLTLSALYGMFVGASVFFLFAAFTHGLKPHGGLTSSAVFMREGLEAAVVFGPWLAVLYVIDELFCDIPNAPFPPLVRGTARGVVASMLVAVAVSCLANAFLWSLVPFLQLPAGCIVREAGIPIPVQIVFSGVAGAMIGTGKLCNR